MLSVTEKNQALKPGTRNPKPCFKTRGNITLQKAIGQILLWLGQRILA